MKDICATGLAKAFGKTLAVDSIDFEVPAGSLVTLLGPSGCGKTTTLRLIAGLEKPDAGEVRVGERVLTSTARGVFVPPDKRRMGMVFQTYAIWPHMSVFENVAFPLRERRVPSTEIRERVMAMLQTLGLEGFHDRPAPLLSGGQQQRVALGRALVADPDVLLLDEPFSNLDARLREDMRLELKEMQKRVGVTTLFVTHDQAEAMILSDRVFVMNAWAHRAGRQPPTDLRAAAHTVRHGLPRSGRSCGCARRADAGRRLRRAAWMACKACDRSRWPRTSRGTTARPWCWRSDHRTSECARSTARGAGKARSFRRCTSASGSNMSSSWAPRTCAPRAR
jgi:ABC-type sulfate/molybdate transport systems ATPase subunit